MPPPRVASAEQQPPQQIAELISEYIATHPSAVLLEAGDVLFDLRRAKFSISTEHGRCTLHLWDDDRNLTRRIVSAVSRTGSLRLVAMRFGQTKPQVLDLVADRDRRTPTARDAARKQYLRVLERVLQREFAEWKITSLQAAMDLERSFGPAYARCVLAKGQQAWAVIAVGADESPAAVEGILTLGILWLQLCRERGEGKRLFQGLRIIVPAGMATLTLARVSWLNPRIAQWEVYELHPRSEELTQREPADHGNLTTRLIHAPNEVAAKERFADAVAQVMALVPEEAQGQVEQRLRSASELAFLIHGLEFARARVQVAANSFRQTAEVSFGAGANETPLSEGNVEELRELTRQLFTRRQSSGKRNDVLYRMQPERWLESLLRTRLELLDEKLQPAPVYTQVPAFAASDRGMLDLLGVNNDGRLAVLELKADEDLHLALQALDYWIRVRWHHLAPPDERTQMNQLQHHGYFPGMRLSPLPPVLYLVAPALRVHPATETVLRYLKPEVEWQLLALDEDWREQIKVIFRKRSTDPR